MSDEINSLWDALFQHRSDLFIAMLISTVFGITSYLHRMYEKPFKGFSIVEFISDSLTAGLCGFIMLMFCLETQQSPWVTGAVVGIAGHAASKILFLLDSWILKKTQSHLNLSREEHSNED